MRRRIGGALAALVTAVLIAICVATVPAFAADSDSADLPYSYVQNNASQATITCDGTVSSAAISDESLGTVAVDGQTVTVTGADGVVSVATVTIVCDGSTYAVEVPLGYSTFSFDGDTLTVYPGSDTSYSVSAIYAPDGSISAKNLSSTTNDDGSVTYTNGETDGTAYSLLVELPKTGGTYVFTGQSDDMAISVKKAATADTTMLLASLDLSSSLTSPITVKKESTATVTVTALAGHDNTLADADFNNADTYGDTADGGDGTNTEYAESSVIKGKDYANIVLNGSGTLNLDCATKNAIKVGEYGSLTIEDLELVIDSAKHGISSDNTLTINSGTLDVTAASDGIRSDPDTVDATAGCTGTITINGGDITINSTTDAIQAAQDLTINGGDFDITTCGGYTSTTFDGDTSSAKGLKASTDTDDTSESTNTVTINGGNFTLNTADDAIHSDAYIVIKGGEYEITTGDDAVHSDTSLTLGEEGGANCAIHLTASACYEGLESGNVYLYSGCYDITASDDGMNAAGGTDSTDEQGTGFNPWGGPGGSGSQASSSAYSLNIAGGLVTINSSGDGIDSNGALNMTGGTCIVWGGSGAENPLDYDGAFTIKGATVLAVGYNQMMVGNPASGSQAYKTQNVSLSKGKTLTVKVNNETLFSLSAPKAAGYVFFSSPSMSSSSSATISVGTGTATGYTNWAEHAWGDPTWTWTQTDDGYEAVATLVCTNDSSHTATVTATVTSEAVDSDTVYTATATYGSYTWTDTYTEEGTVDPYDISNASVAVDDQVCTSEELEPELTVTLADATLTAGTDYTAVYSDNIYAGTATVTLTGTGDYTGTKTATFNITYPFSDINDDTPHVLDICWLAASGITTGYEDGTYRGMWPVYRQDMAAFLYRLAGSPEYEVTDEDLAKFTDVDESTPHYKEICWLAHTGISTGWEESDGIYTFRGTAEVVRQDMAAFLYRLAGSPEFDVTDEDLATFSDVDESTPHYKEVLWLASVGVTTGYEDGTFQGMWSVYRQDMAAFLHRMDSIINAAS